MFDKEWLKERMKNHECEDPLMWFKEMDNRVALETLESFSKRVDKGILNINNGCNKKIINDETKDVAQTIDLREFSQQQLLQLLQKQIGEIKVELECKDMSINSLKEAYKKVKSENTELKAKLKNLESIESHICTGELPY